ncbi:hypothetical protein PM082_016262 [Marasmius tenuissimus]|nr:hypothetical protein PM082_016262 [Marasmius tenuissimus]
METFVSFTRWYWMSNSRSVRGFDTPTSDVVPGWSRDQKQFQTRHITRLAMGKAQ